VFVNKIIVLFIMFEFEACEVFKTKDFTFVNDCFKYERNEEIRHYGQTLTNNRTLFYSVMVNVSYL
jgi:hypothetical protein